MLDPKKMLLTNYPDTLKGSASTVYSEELPVSQLD